MNIVTDSDRIDVHSKAILTALDMMNDGNDWIVDIDLKSSLTR